jgi:hypothetical protein
MGADAGGGYFRWQADGRRFCRPSALILPGPAGSEFMVVERTFDPGLAARFVTDPAAIKAITTAIKDTNNVCLVGDLGAFIAARLDRGVFEIVLHAEPEADEEWLRDFIAAAAEYVFCRTDAVELLVRAARGDPASEAMVRAAPSDLQFEIAARLEVHALTLQRWALWAPGMVERGERLVDRIAAQLQRERHPIHPDHARVIGVAVAMIEGEQPIKGVVWFNRAEALARRPLIKILDTDPLQIKWETEMLTLQNGEVSISAVH